MFIRTPRIIAALILSLSCALTASACVQEADTRESGQAVQPAALAEGAGGVLRGRRSRDGVLHRQFPRRYLVAGAFPCVFPAVDDDSASIQRARRADVRRWPVGCRPGTGGAARDASAPVAIASSRRGRRPRGARGRRPSGAPWSLLMPGPSSLEDVLLELAGLPGRTQPAQREVSGAHGRDFIEAHHTTPLSHLDGERETRVEDLTLVCANCHRMLHCRRPWLGMADIREMLSGGSKPPDKAVQRPVASGVRH